MEFQSRSYPTLFLHDLFLIKLDRIWNRILYPRSYRKHFCIFVLAPSSLFSSPAQHYALLQQFANSKIVQVQSHFTSCQE
ncbi:hypothetical protein VNO77_09838 [Canavalia gladiata]|uniref:Uncharacterized protein n=1 Tax=Canavalia gladiata TaxID=3824 RepID=A0AAN9MGA5_CANGL